MILNRIEEMEQKRIRHQSRWLYHLFCSVILMFGILLGANVNGASVRAEGEDETEEPSYYADFDDLQVDDYDDYNLTISWYSEGTNTGFDIYRKAAFQPDYEFLESVENEQYEILEYTDFGFRRGFKYSYRVVAYQELEDSGQHLELGTKEKSWKFGIDQVEMKSVKRLQKVKAKVSWKKSSGVDGYEIYKKAAGGTYKRAKKITSEDTLAYTLTNISQKKNTYYKVRAYVYEGGKYAYGKFSTTVKLAKSILSKIAEKFKQLQKKYPDGKYWNHAGKINFNSSTITDRPCRHNSYDGLADTCNFYYCPDGIIGYQCYGFAWLMSDLIYGKSAKIKNFYSFDKCKAGDVIRYDGHSVIIVSKKSDYVTVGECNYGDTCVIKWGRKVYAWELLGAKYSRRYK